MRHDARRRRVAIERIALPVVAYALVLALWTGLVDMTRTTVFPSPAAALSALRVGNGHGVLSRHIGSSLTRVGIGYTAAVILGLPIGLLMGRSRLAHRFFAPGVELMRPISPLAWAPLAILWFGLSGATTVALIFIAAIFPVIVSTAAAVRSVSQVHVDAGRNFGLSTGELLCRIYAPAALPRIFVGLRVALGTAWMVLVAAEMIAVNSGLGYLVIDARNAGKRYDLVVGTMILIGGIGLLLDVMLRQCVRTRWLRWSVTHDHRAAH